MASQTISADVIGLVNLAVSALGTAENARGDAGIGLVAAFVADAQAPDAVGERALFACYRERAMKRGMSKSAVNATAATARALAAKHAVQIGTALANLNDPQRNSPVTREERFRAVRDVLMGLYQTRNAMLQAAKVSGGNPVTDEGKVRRTVVTLENMVLGTAKKPPLVNDAAILAQIGEALILRSKVLNRGMGPIPVNPTTGQPEDTNEHIMRVVRDHFARVLAMGQARSAPCQARAHARA